MEKRFDVFTVGGVVRDINFYTNKGRVLYTPENMIEQKVLGFEYGAKIPITEAFFSIGGGASNTANVFAKLGLKTSVLARIGDDEDGHHILCALEDKHIYVDGIQKDQKTRTGLSFIICTSKKEGEHIAFTYRGANDNLVLHESDLRQMRADCFYITSLSGDDWMKILHTLVKHGKDDNSLVAWNPGTFQLQAGKKILEEILAKVDVLILNKDEAIELALSGIKIGKRNPRFLNKTLYLLNILSEWGPNIVVITEGRKGASSLSQGVLYKVKAVRKLVIDTIGVGDVFGATFIAGILENSKDIDMALRWAAVNSAYALTKPGAEEGALTREELLKKIR